MENDFFLEHFHWLNLIFKDKTEKRQRSILLFSVPVNVMLINSLRTFKILVGSQKLRPKIAKKLAAEEERL